MKRLFLIFNIVVILALAGCASENYSNEKNVGTAETTVSFEDNNKNSASSSDVANTTGDLAEKFPAFGQTLENYYTALSEKWDEERLMEAGISGLCTNFYSGNPLESMGYTLTDLNNDGVDELLIGSLANDGEYCNEIYDMYALVDGVETHIFGSSQEGGYYLVPLTDECDSFEIVMYGEPDENTRRYESYIWNGDKMRGTQAVEYLSTSKHPWMMGWDDGGTFFFTEEISESMGQSIMESYKTVMMKPEYTAFDKVNE